MKKNKGFTLVELLAVIVILAVILVIAIPNVMKIIDKARLDSYNKNKDFVERVAKAYLTSNTSLLPQNLGDTYIMSLGDLIGTNYIDNIKDPKSNTICDNTNSIIKIKNIGFNVYKYDTFLQCDNYKTDITVPDINTTITGNRVDVVGSDSTGIYFDGVNDYVGIPHSSSLNLAYFTIYTNLNYPTSGLQTGIIFNKESAYETQFLSGPKAFQNASTPNFSWRGTLVLPSAQDNDTFTTWDGSIQTLNVNSLTESFDLVDGSATNSAAGLGIAARGLNAAGTSGANSFLKIRINQMIIWNVALSQSEIQGVMNGVIPKTTNIAAYYKFDESSGTILNDSSGNNNHGTVYGGATWVVNSGVKRIRIDGGAWTTGKTASFLSLTTGSHVIQVEDNAGNVASKTITI
jgi:type IV pilus assembly protein PilA